VLLVPAGNPVAFAKRADIASFAQRNRLPSMYGNKEYVDAGGLMSYGPSSADNYRRAATYVDISKHVGRVNSESIVVDEIVA
jgi:hypothetical protein